MPELMPEPTPEPMSEPTPVPPDTVEVVVDTADPAAVNVTFTDTVTGLTASKTINISDLSEEADIDERVASHKRTFLYRIKIGVITPPVVEENVVMQEQEV